MKKVTIVVMAYMLYATAIACMYTLYEFVKYCKDIPLWCCVVVTIVLISTIISSAIAGTALLDQSSS